MNTSFRERKVTSLSLRGARRTARRRQDVTSTVALALAQLLARGRTPRWRSRHTYIDPAVRTDIDVGMKWKAQLNAVRLAYVLMARSSVMDLSLARVNLGPIYG